MTKARSDARRPVLEDVTAARLRAELASYLARRAGNPALAEDLAQEAMLRVVQGLPEFRGGAQLRTWARRVALNVWRDHLRRRAASPAERAASGEEFSVHALLDSIGPTAPAPSPEDAYDQRVTQDCLLAAARRLPLAEGEIILLHDFGAIPLEQAASALGCSPGAAKVRLHRARRHLAELCRTECTSDAGRMAARCVA
ncbi:MAG: RNA polymerase sigma factor, partial [Planctomycetes bacterium]|nr:RNA polymerase sigma factor [Planctomycetota bacterium]